MEENEGYRGAAPPIEFRTYGRNYRPDCNNVKCLLQFHGRGIKKNQVTMTFAEKTTTKPNSENCSLNVDKLLHIFFIAVGEYIPGQIQA